MSKGRRARRAAGQPTTGRLLGAAVLAVALIIGAVAFRLAGGPTPAALDSDASGTIPLLGSSVLSPANLTRTTAQFGHMPIVRVYFPGLPGRYAWTSIAGVNKSAVIVSFKARPAAILSGADDARLRQFFATAPRGRPIYYSYFHEPEDNIARGQFTAAAYRAAWKHIAALADAAGNPYLHATLILMSYDLVPGSAPELEGLPARAAGSSACWAGMPTRSAARPTCTRGRPPRRASWGRPSPPRAASGLPYGFAEFGLSTAHGQAGLAEAAWASTCCTAGRCSPACSTGTGSTRRCG